MKKLYSLLIMMALFTLSAWAQSWVLTAASDLQTGDVVVIAETTAGHAMSNDKGASSAPSAVSIEFDTDKSEITSTVADNLKWTVTVSDDGYQFNATATTWLYTIAQNNGVRVGDNTSNKTFTIDAETGYLMNSGTNRYLGVYNDRDWRCYTSINSNITGQEFAFFKYVAPVTDEFTVTATPAPGTYDAPQTVTLATQNATGDVLMYYTLDGTDPETSATQIEYTAPFAINETKTLRVYAMDDGGNEATFEGEYTITPLTITADPAAGTYAGTQTVTLSASAEVTEWAWEFTPTGGTAVEGTTNTVTVDQSGSLYVLATDSYNRTAEATFAYTITEAPQEATFIFNTDEGLQELGITKPNSNDATDLDGKSYTKAPITVSFAKSSASTSPRVWHATSGALTLRLYNGNTITFAAAEGYKISGITAKNGNTTTTALSTTPETPQQNVVINPTSTVQTGTITVSYIEDTPALVTTDLADILAGEDDASYNVTEELAVLNVFDKVGYATINVAGNKDFIALDFSDTDITPAEGTVYGNISGTLSAVKTNPVLKVTAAEVSNATVVAEPMTVDLTQVFYVPGNAFVTVAGYVDANGKLRAYNTLETHGGQSIDLDRSLLTQNLALVEGKKYIFNGVMTLKEAWTESTGAPRRVASGDLEGRYYDNYTFTATAVEEAPVITGVDNIAAGKEVKTVRYFDVAGRASAQPVQGVNIVVVEYQDGTQSVSKVVR